MMADSSVRYQTIKAQPGFLTGENPENLPPGVKTMPIFEYTGPVYVRPVSRGIVLIDHPEKEQLEDLLVDGLYTVKIVIEEMSAAERQAVPKPYGEG